MSKPTKIDIESQTLVRFWLIPLGFSLGALLLYRARTALLIIGAALFLALALSPLIKKISNILPSKSRSLSITLAYTLVIGIILAFIAIVAPAVLNELFHFISGLPALLSGNSEALSLVDQIGSKIGVLDLREHLFAGLGQFTNLALNNIGAIVTGSINSVASGITALILVLVLSLFMLLEGPSIVKAFWQNFKNAPHAKRNARTIERMAETISKYVSNAIGVSLINTSCSTVTVFILSLVFGFSPSLALPFGLITGFFSLIPMFGSFLGGCIVAILLALNNWAAGLIFIIYTIIYLQIESNIISPKIQGRGLRLPALVVLSSVTIGVYMFGLVGAIIAIPVAACIKVLIEEYGKSLIDNDDEVGDKKDAKNEKETAPKTTKETKEVK